MQKSKKKHELLIIAGPNGSGKTTITKQLLAHDWMSGKQYINPDEIANYLGDWNNPEKVLQAAQTATSLRNLYLRSNQSFAFETVFSTQEKVNFLKQAKAADFFISVPMIPKLILNGLESVYFKINMLSLKIK